MESPQTNRAELKPILDFKKPLDMVDILELSRTNSGNKCVIVFSDYLSRWVEAFPMKDMRADTIV